ncbi:hypothetical protein ASPZODRAFT_27817 [Penicilliopsis zonata CBS 506.65]|uniref:Uncharacterized protein n=1 Tax=Penicilliopsis zonata CBS 506.65 TaxID=1073090 RepID=A0A1L9SA05_9EURO|nr:hypothetical protein ASPZODRAFT_27817 [Penicilliopsis zonata CBS 506.65]OJJ44010.1 hypothetical protein ASPZODRAFT_27817 [Penicilliopsis zonata CBS 506.65]
MAQALSLRAALVVLCKDVHNHGVSETDLVNLAEAINRAWIESKDEQTTLELKDNRDLQRALSAVFPEHDFSNRQLNPLNKIIPGFETLWRIVLMTFLEVGFKAGRQHPEWREALVAFAKIPGKVQFETAEPVSVQFLVNEALRLHPPTKRIYRAYKATALDEHTRITSANIEACHTAPATWGPTAMTFDPLRWTHSTQEQNWLLGLES